MTGGSGCPISASVRVLTEQLCVTALSSPSWVWVSKGILTGPSKEDERGSRAGDNAQESTLQRQGTATINLHAAEHRLRWLYLGPSRGLWFEDLPVLLLPLLCHSRATIPELCSSCKPWDKEAVSIVLQQNLSGLYWPRLPLRVGL